MRNCRQALYPPVGAFRRAVPGPFTDRQPAADPSLVSTSAGLTHLDCVARLRVASVHATSRLCRATMRCVRGLDLRLGLGDVPCWAGQAAGQVWDAVAVQSGQCGGAAGEGQQ
jgi:hypothetical protein